MAKSVNGMQRCEIAEKVLEVVNYKHGYRDIDSMHTSAIPPDEFTVCWGRLLNSSI
jgi:hypothetical protein